MLSGTTAWYAEVKNYFRIRFIYLDFCAWPRYTVLPHGDAVLPLERYYRVGKRYYRVPVRYYRLAERYYRMLGRRSVEKPRNCLNERKNRLDLQRSKERK